MAVDIAGSFLPGKVLTSSTNVCGKEGFLAGIFVSAASATPTITIYDDAATGTSNSLVSVFTPAAATWYPIPLHFFSGCYVVISGTVSCTVSVIGARN